MNASFILFLRATSCPARSALCCCVVLRRPGKKEALNLLRSLRSAAAVMEPVETQSLFRIETYQLHCRAGAQTQHTHLVEFRVNSIPHEVTFQFARISISLIKYNGNKFNSCFLLQMHCFSKLQVMNSYSVRQNVVKYTVHKLKTHQ